MNGSTSEVKATRRDLSKSAIPEPKVLYPCESLEQLQLLLDHLHQNSAQSLIPENVLFQAAFTPEVVFDTSEATTEQDAKSPEEPSNFTGYFPIPPSISVAEVVSDEKSEKQKLELRKAVSKALITGISKSDGFHYRKRPEWHHRKDGIFTHKYLCKAALAAPSNRAKKATEEKEADDGSPREEAKDVVDVTAPIDCKGVVIVKFMERMKRVDLIYSHTPVHLQQEQGQAVIENLVHQEPDDVIVDNHFAGAGAPDLVSYEYPDAGLRLEENSESESWTPNHQLEEQSKPAPKRRKTNNTKAKTSTPRTKKSAAPGPTESSASKPKPQRSQKRNGSRQAHPSLDT